MKRPVETMPPHWLGYVTVADVDATVKKADALGGQVCMPPMDVPTVGRIAILQDPPGASIGIFQPLGTPAPRARNQVVWFDIPAKDLDRAVRFYSAVLGAPIKRDQCGDNSTARASASPCIQSDIKLTGSASRRTHPIAPRARGSASPRCPAPRPASCPCGRGGRASSPHPRGWT